MVSESSEKKKKKKKKKSTANSPGQINDTKELFRGQIVAAQKLADAKNRQVENVILVEKRP